MKLATLIESLHEEIMGHVRRAYIEGCVDNHNNPNMAPIDLWNGSHMKEFVERNLPESKDGNTHG